MIVNKQFVHHKAAGSLSKTGGVHRFIYYSSSLLAFIKLIGTTVWFIFIFNKRVETTYSTGKKLNHAQQHHQVTQRQAHALLYSICNYNLPWHGHTAYCNRAAGGDTTQYTNTLSPASRWTSVTLREKYVSNINFTQSRYNSHNSTTQI